MRAVLGRLGVSYYNIEIKIFVDELFLTDSKFLFANFCLIEMTLVSEYHLEIFIPF
jgi:hypothetical protein